MIQQSAVGMALFSERRIHGNSCTQLVAESLLGELSAKIQKNK
jgi:hypothetical protein